MLLPLTIHHVSRFCYLLHLNRNKFDLEMKTYEQNYIWFEKRLMVMDLKWPLRQLLEEDLVQDHLQRKMGSRNWNN